MILTNILKLCLIAHLGHIVGSQPFDVFPIAAANSSASLANDSGANAATACDPSDILRVGGLLGQCPLGEVKKIAPVEPSKRRYIRSPVASRQLPAAGLNASNVSSIGADQMPLAASTKSNYTEPPVLRRMKCELLVELAWAVSRCCGTMPAQQS